MVMTANPSTLIQLAKLADARKDDLIRDIADGTLSEAANVPGEVRQALGRRISPAKTRPAPTNLKRSSSGAAISSPATSGPRCNSWPIWTGGSVGAYLPALRNDYGQIPIRDHGLSASEGRMTIPVADGTAAGILDVATHFFEFIPENEYGSPDPTVLEAHELEEGKNYYILLTTSSGLTATTSATWSAAPGSIIRRRWSSSCTKGRTSPT